MVSIEILRNVMVTNNVMLRRHFQQLVIKTIIIFEKLREKQLKNDFLPFIKISDRMSEQ